MEARKKAGPSTSSPKGTTSEATAGSAALQEERVILARIHKLEKSVTEKAQLECLNDLITTCVDTRASATVTFNTLRALQRAFAHLAAKGVLDFGAPTDKAPLKGAAASPKNSENDYKAITLAYHKAYVKALLNLLLHRHDQVKTLALKLLMDTLHAKTTTFNKANNENTFPLKHISLIIERLLMESNGMETGLFKQFLGKYLTKYYDVSYYTLKSLRALSEQRKSGHQSSTMTIEAMYLLLQKVTVPSSDQMINSFWIPPNASLAQAETHATNMKTITKKMKSKAQDDLYLRKKLQTQKKRAKGKIAQKKKEGSLAIKYVSGHRKIFEECWIAFLALPLTAPIYKDVLRRMDTHILPFMINPVRLIDFLKDSYDVGGVVSILALHGLFVLITKHNLDFPDFYKKLYALFQPNIFHVKYRAKFFRLVELFLKSSHLPAYLVAAFVKRMARMALHAPPSGALFVIAFAYNMLKRHPQCLIMLHHASDIASGSLLPTDSRKPTGAKKNEEVLMLAVSDEGTAAPVANGDHLNHDSVLMLDSTSVTSSDAESKKRKWEEEQESSSNNKAATNGTASLANGALVNKKRRRGRGDADNDKRKEEDETVEEAERPEKSGKNASSVPLEENEIALARHLHLGAAGSDPFIFEELDPQKCKAMSSSLWELKALQHHYEPQVSQLAKIFDEPPVKQPFNLDDFIDLSYLSLFEGHIKRKTKSTTSMTYQPQETLFAASDVFQTDWTFE